MEQKSLPPFIGIRIKPFTEELRARSYAHPRYLRNLAVRRFERAAPSEFRRHAPEGHDRRASAGARRGLRYARKRPCKLPVNSAQIRDHDRDPRSRSSIPPAPPAIQHLVAAAAGAVRRGPPGDLRLHRELQHHRGAPGDESPLVRFREAHDASRARADGALDERRRDEHHARPPPPRRSQWPTADAGPAASKTATPCMPLGASTRRKCGTHS